MKDIKIISTILLPDKLNEYKEKFDNFMKQNPTEKSSKTLIKKEEQIKPLQPTAKMSTAYSDFWKVADKVKDLVEDIVYDEYPDIPAYLVIDHFWHWVVKVCDQKRLAVFKDGYQTKEYKIIEFFKEYCKWDKSASGGNYLTTIHEKSKKLQKILSKDNLHNLDKMAAIEVFSTFHSTQGLIQRFGAHKDFVDNNPISNIRDSLEYFLNSEENIDIKIHNMISKNNKNKLVGLGKSSVQELSGWFRPMEMPIRNEKADKAIRLLGFRQLKM